MIKRVVKHKIFTTNNPLFLRLWSTTAKVASKKPKNKTQEATKNLKPSKQVQQYFEEHNPAILDQFPVKMLRNKQRTPDSLYVCHKNAVKPIVDQLRPKLDKAGRQIPLIEVNPGPGLITNALLRKGFKNLLLFEACDAFQPNLEAICSNHPKCTTLKHADCLNLWKLVYQDKLDNGDRVARLLNDLTKQKWDGELSTQIFASVGHVNFFKHLINSIVFQNSLLSYGRCEMILCVPPPLYIHLTCSNQAGYLMYRSTTMLFQIMFEHEFIGKIPREYFLPWQVSPDLSSRNKLSKVKSVDPNFVYLIKVVPRKELYELCPAEHMQGLWYFVKQHAVSRKNRVIPTLEHWIPGSGFRLITNTKKAVPVQPLSKKATDLPPMCTPATTMSTHDFLKHINIFTQFGDVTPSQMLTLFDQFHKWPEYTQQCPFVSSMETSFMKMEASADQNIDGIPDEDDVSENQDKGDNSLK